MPIPFRDAADVEELGAAAFLKIAPAPGAVASGQWPVASEASGPASPTGPWPGAGGTSVQSAGPGGTAGHWPLTTDHSGRGAGAGLVGALFLVNARGEPLEFAYNRIAAPDTFLWRAADLRRHAERKLTASLLTICARTPRLLLCFADEVGSELFCQDLQLSIPVGRIGRPLQAAAYSSAEVEEVLAEPEPLHLFWYPAPPAPESVERRTLDRLTAHGLLLEPFERAAIGLREVYGGHGGYGGCGG